jgi:uncharacterized protein
MNELIFGPWAWYVVGPLITVLMVTMFYFGKTFGVSSNFRTICAMTGAGKYAEFFRFDWKSQIWNLVFIFGTLIGGFIGKQFLTNYDTIELSESTKSSLADFDISTENQGLSPQELFSWEHIGDTKTLIIVIVGGFLIGFGTRYAGGCTSGHAITGLSNLQIPSLVAVVGFFIGGLLMTWFILPFILKL